MTDQPTRSARWTVAIVAAPVAAGLFAGATSWTIAHHPAPTTTVAVAGPPPRSDPALVALRATAGVRQRQVGELKAKVRTTRRQLAAERARLTSLAGAASGPIPAAPGSGGSTASVRTQRAPVIRAAAPAPAPAPAAHTSTGGSGAKK